MVRQKRRRWACADCGSTINDESMRQVDTHSWEAPRYAEFCSPCGNYNPEVVMKFD